MPEIRGDKLILFEYEYIRPSGGDLILGPQQLSVQLYDSIKTARVTGVRPGSETLLEPYSWEVGDVGSMKELAQKVQEVPLDRRGR